MLRMPYHEVVAHSARTGASTRLVASAVQAVILGEQVEWRGTRQYQIVAIAKGLWKW
jgi:hypothetical protein